MNRPPQVMMQFQGGPAQQPAQQVYPSYPYVRAPRDFFMWSETYEDEVERLRLPALIP
jgi:hypothetical protein